MLYKEYKGSLGETLGTIPNFTMANSPYEIRLKTTSLQVQASTFSTTPEKMICKSSTNASSMAERMAGKTPVQIGTRGTVGSLITQEIEYFTQLEKKSQNISQKPFECKLPDEGSTSSCSKPNLGSIITIPRKKKKGSSRLLPSMCSMVDVVEKRNQPDLSSTFSYRSLKADVSTLQV